QERVAVLRLAGDLVALGHDLGGVAHHHVDARQMLLHPRIRVGVALGHRDRLDAPADHRSEEHTSELQSRFDLVCRLLLEKNKCASRLCGLMPYPTPGRTTRIINNILINRFEKMKLASDHNAIPSSSG